MADPTLISDGIRERDLDDPDAVITHPEPQLVQVVMRTDDWDRLVAGDPHAHDDCGEYDDDYVIEASELAREEGRTAGWEAACDAVRKLAEASA